MKKWNILISALICASVDFVLIPSFLMRGVPDWIWMTLMAGLRRR